MTKEYAKISIRLFHYLCTYDLYSPVHNVLGMRANPLRGEVGGGWALEFEPFGAQKAREFQAHPPPTFSSNGYARIQNIMHRAV